MKLMECMLLCVYFVDLNIDTLRDLINEQKNDNILQFTYLMGQIIWDMTICANELEQLKDLALTIVLLDLNITHQFWTRESLKHVIKHDNQI